MRRSGGGKGEGREKVKMTEGGIKERKGEMCAVVLEGERGSKQNRMTGRKEGRKEMFEK